MVLLKAFGGSWLVAILLLVPLSVPAQEVKAQEENGLALTHDNFCQLAQQLMVDTELTSDNQIHTSTESFKKSKPKEHPLITHQFVNYELPDGSISGTPISISCKLKTAERINRAWQASTGNADSLVAKSEGSCKNIHQRMWQAVRAGMPSGHAVREIMFDEDENTVIGPFWLNPWPYPVAFLDENQALHVVSKSLHVEYSMFIPMPDAFMGTHYCHLIAPEYLAQLALGTVVAPALSTLGN